MATLKTTKNGFQDQLLLNAGQKYCRMLHGEHSTILSTFIKLPSVIKVFVLSIFEWPFYTGCTVHVFIVGKQIGPRSSQQNVMIDLDLKFLTVWYIPWSFL